MGATFNEAGVAEAAATGAAEISSTDLAFLRSLDAKIKEMAEAEGIPASSVASRASAASEPTALAPGTIRNARRGYRATALPPIDSTQTVRALTSLELEAYEASRWFAIELMLSAHGIDAAKVPNLGIFEEYKLYAVATPAQGGRIHALRLGFFSSEIAADAVLRYLAEYFPSAAMRRVSIAEYERFGEGLVMAGKNVGASGTRAAIELVSVPLAPRAANRYSNTQIIKPSERT